MAEQFKDGDEVRLKSGGPWMTVERYGTFAGREGYLCKWFDSKHELQSGVFTADTLELKQPEPKSFGGTVSRPSHTSWMGN